MKCERCGKRFDGELYCNICPECGFYCSEVKGYNIDTYYSTYSGNTEKVRDMVQEKQQNDKKKSKQTAFELDIFGGMGGRIGEIADLFGDIFCGMLLPFVKGIWKVFVYCAKDVKDTIEREKKQKECVREKFLQVHKGKCQQNGIAGRQQGIQTGASRISDKDSRKNR